MNNLKKNIRKILKEQGKTWSTETTPFKNRDRQQRFGKLLVKERHKGILAHQKKQNTPPEEGYPRDFDEFVKLLKDDFPNWEDFGRSIQVIINTSNIIDGMDPKFVAKLVAEYILNSGGGDTHERVDIVEERELFDYIDAQFFDCSDQFFENMWDKILTGRSNYWNEGIKDNMWAEIEDEVETKMSEAEESGEESEFDGDIRQEEDYFHSYWYYPLHSLGWDRITLCDWYKEYINQDDIQKHFFSAKDGITDSNGKWGKFPITDANIYVIHRNSLF